MKTILVAGGAGFIGSHLCEKLLSLDNRVICVDNLSTGRVTNIEHLEENTNFTRCYLSITNYALLIKELQDYGFDTIDEIYNLASPASPVIYKDFRLDTIYTNSFGVNNLLSLADLHDAKFLQASTSEIYGDPLISPQDETYNGNISTFSPRSCYCEGKRFAESLIYNFGEEYKLNTKVARIFNTYGPRMRHDDGRVVSEFLVRRIKGLPLQIYGNGQQTRSFCYVTDTVDGLIALMESNISTPINIGNPVEMTIQQLAEKVVDLTSHITSQLIPIHYIPKMFEDDPKRRCPDITKALLNLNWKPKVTLEEGLTHTYNYYLERLNDL
jgi:UDP-glucuronate decarboxylase